MADADRPRGPPGVSEVIEREAAPRAAGLGQVRYKNASGLERKFDMAAYLSAVDDLVEAERR